MRYVAFLILSFVLLTNCSSFSWESIYSNQKELFHRNQHLFNEALIKIKAASFNNDTTIRSSNYKVFFDNELADSLVRLDILSIEYKPSNFQSWKSCVSDDVNFELGDLWHKERFSVLQICNSPCDEKSIKDYHWTLQGSDHKHAFGFGNGWYLYTDSDSDPF